MKRYEMPEVKMRRFEAEDIITVSAAGTMTVEEWVRSSQSPVNSVDYNALSDVLEMDF